MGSIFSYVAEGRNNLCVNVCIRYEYSLVYIVHRGLCGPGVTCSLAEPARWWGFCSPPSRDIWPFFFFYSLLFSFYTLNILNPVKNCCTLERLYILQIYIYRFRNYSRIFLCVVAFKIIFLLTKMKTN